MRPRDRMILPLALFVAAIVLAAFINFLVRNDDRSFQALLVVGAMLSPVLAYTFGAALLKRTDGEG